jgi:hypothetical protein
MEPSLKIDAVFAQIVELSSKLGQVSRSNALSSTSGGFANLGQVKDEWLPVTLRETLSRMGIIHWTISKL